MARRAPYHAVTGQRHGGYVAVATRYPCGAIRPHRNAAGMTYTASRGGGEMDDVTRRLAVFGTWDRVGQAFRRYTALQRKRCPCCGQERMVRYVTEQGMRWIAQKKMELARRAEMR